MSIRDLTDVPTVWEHSAATTDMGDLKGIITTNLSAAQSSHVVGRGHSVVDPRNTFYNLWACGSNKQMEGRGYEKLVLIVRLFGS